MSFGSVGSPPIIGPGSGGDPATGGGWYVLRFTNGAIGIQRIDPGNHPPANTAKAIWISPPDLGFGGLQNDYGANLAWALGHIGGSVAQLSKMVAELDHGAGTHDSLRWLYVGGTGSVSSNVNTSTKQGDATAINQIPSPISPQAGNKGGTSALDRVVGSGGLLGAISFPPVFSLLGSLGFWKGVGLVLAGAAILAVAAMELRKL